MGVNLGQRQNHLHCMGVDFSALKPVYFVPQTIGLNGRGPGLGFFRVSPVV